jgi:putative transposase
MKPILCALLTFLVTLFRLRLSMQLEIMALRHQISVYQRSSRRLRLKPGDRILWSWLSQLWSGWQKVLSFVQPRTVIAWQRKRFRDYWAKLSQGSQPGRPAVSQEIRALIRKLSTANPTWGSPRIVGTAFS